MFLNLLRDHRDGTETLYWPSQDTKNSNFPRILCTISSSARTFVLIFLMHSWASHLFISLPQCSSDIHKRRMFGVKYPIRPLWMSKSPSRCMVLSVGQRLCAPLLIATQLGGRQFFNSYHACSSTAPNNMPLLWPFIRSKVSEELTALKM